MVGGSDPFYLTFWVKLTQLEQKRRYVWKKFSGLVQMYVDCCSVR